MGLGRFFGGFGELGAATVAVDVDFKQFNRGLALARNEVRATAVTMDRELNASAARGAGAGRILAAGLALGTAAAGAAVLAVGKLVLSTIRYGDEVGKTSTKIGIQAEALQELRFAADRSGASQQALDMALQRFSRRVGEAAQGQGALKDVLQQYNIAVRDATGVMRPLEDILGDVAEATRNAESEQEKLRIAFKAFDTEGAVLVNLMREGRAGMNSLREQARALGGVLSNEAVRAAEAAQDAITNFNTAITGLGRNLATSLLPLLTDVINKFLDLADLRVGEVILDLNEEIASLNQTLADTVLLIDEQARAGGDPRVIQSLKEQLLLYTQQRDALVQQRDALRDRNAALREATGETRGFVPPVVAEESVGRERPEAGLPPLDEPTIAFGTPALDFARRLPGRAPEASEEDRVEGVERANEAVKDFLLTNEQITQTIVGEVAIFQDLGNLTLDTLLQSLAQIPLRLADAVVQALLFRAIMASLGGAGGGLAFGGAAFAQPALPGAGATGITGFLPAQHGAIFKRGELALMSGTRGAALIEGAGDEAVLPLAQTASGQLGVRASGGNRGGNTINIFAPNAVPGQAANLMNAAAAIGAQVGAAQVRGSGKPAF